MKAIWSKFPRKLIGGGGRANQRVLLGLALLLIVVGGGYLYLTSSDRGVGIEFDLPEDIHAGDIFEAEIRVENNTKGPMEETKLTMTLPEGVRLVGNGERVNEIRELGRVGLGGVAKEKFQLVALPSEDKDDHRVVVAVNHRTPSLSANFTQDRDFKVDVNSYDFGLEVALPETVLVGQEFDVSLKYTVPEETGNERLARRLTIEDEQLVFVSSDPESGEPSWTIGESGEHEVRARIKALDPGTDLFELDARIVSDFSGEEFVLEQESTSTLLAASPLTFEIRTDDPKEAVVPGELVGYNIVYKNNTGTDLRDVLIRAELVGDMFDTSTVDTKGAFNTLGRSVVWDSRRFGELKNVRVGDEGSFRVSVRVRQSFPIDRINDKNFILRVSGTMESPTITENSSSDRTSASSFLETKVAGQVQVGAFAYFRDANSGILNSGPFPPQTGRSTNYTIHWSLANFGTDVSDVEVRARLEGGVSFTGEVKSNTGEVPRFDDVTGEVVWQVGSLRATEGVLSSPPEAIFQVEAVPSASLIGQFMPLISITSVSASDDFTGVALLDTDGALTTQLPDDLTVSGNQGRVVSN